MGASINIDIGGTFTDCFVVHEGRLVKGKSSTTHYNLSVGFMRSIETACEGLGLTLGDVLAATDLIRYSTTLATNALIERSGPKLGLITTAGFEDTILIGRARQWADGRNMESKVNLSRIEKPVPLIPREMIVGVRERVDCTGEVIIPLREEEVLEKLQVLVDKGAMGVVVSLLWSFLNPAHERLVREMVEREYPEVYLGSIPTFLSHEVSPVRGEYPRTMTTIINAYTHRDLREQLGALRQDLKQAGYRKPFMMVNNSGGMADLARTSAVSTHNSGPVAGLLGARYLNDQYGIRNTLVTDMGGTSFDYGLIVDNQPRFCDLFPTIDTWRVQLSMLEMKTIGAGGGSIARVHPDIKTIEVGPRSAGSMPGPACYDLGGKEPTVTDADLVLGYLNPEYFLGGQMLLSRERAVAAIRDAVAKPLGMDVEEAAAGIRKIVDSAMGQCLATEIALKGHDPKNFQLFAYGGGGPTHCCDYAKVLQIDRIFTFPFASVFCAFGASTLDVVHTYEASKQIVLYEPQLRIYFSEYDDFNRAVGRLREQAIRDMCGEGFNELDIRFRLEVELKYGTQRNMTVIAVPDLVLMSEEDVKRVCDIFTREYARVYGAASAYPQGGIQLERLRLTAVCPAAKFELPRYEPNGSDPKRALKGRRDVYWEETNGFRPTPVYDHALLGCGGVVEGPAIIESRDTTWVVPQGMRYETDHLLNGILTRMDRKPK